MSTTTKAAETNEVKEKIEAEKVYTEAEYKAVTEELEKYKQGYAAMARKCDNAMAMYGELFNRFVESV